MKKLIIFCAIAGTLVFLFSEKSYCVMRKANGSGSGFNTALPDPNPPPPDADANIQVAILLDASNSMDGLIDQAKSRLWNIVNTLTTLKYNGKTTGIQISLYMYGNDGLPAHNNFIRQITPFTSDLDLISEKLFAITTNGGSEYCGAVIDDAVKNLNWGNRSSDMKLIYIAGNEPFNQGGISYKEAISGATGKEIFINTIHCGDCYAGVSGFWKDGAERGRGKYFCINSDERVAFIETPYDTEIESFNQKLNGTYIYYGAQGAVGYTKQAEQDRNAGHISKSNQAERIVSKSKAIYKNESWDLIDKVTTDSTYVDKVEKKTLPKEYQNMAPAQFKAVVKQKANERATIQKQISELSKKRQLYIDEESKKKAGKDDFGVVVKNSILDLAKLKGYKSE